MTNIEKKYFRKEILKVSLPAIAGVSSQVIVSLVDTAMVGRLGNSEHALAAMGLGVLATWAITSFFSSLSAGTHIMIARRVGENDNSGVKVILNNSLFFSFFIGLIVAAIIFTFVGKFTYLIAVDPNVEFLATEYISFRFISLPFFLMVVCYRGFFFGIGHTKIFMISGIIINLVNIFFNWVLIFGNLGFPAYGLKGAAIASSLATIVDFFFYFFVTLNRTYRKKYISKTFFKIDFKLIWRIINLSLPVSFQNVFILIGFLSFLSITGLLGTINQAASQAVISSIFISLMPCFGFGIAAQTLVGNQLGNKNFKAAEFLGFEIGKMATYFTIVVAIIFISVPDLVLNLITTNEAIIQRGKFALRIAGFSQIFYGFAIVLANSLQTAGKTFFVMMVEVITNWFIFVPLAYFLGIVLKLGFEGLWMSLPIYIIFYTFILFIKFKFGNWKNQSI